MDKRYQVFVSSTYRDLQDERREVMQALLELDCIPSGMELFPAADEDQWTLIKRVIDDCDYYLVIVAGRYGSLAPGGQSYTEMEYRYAVEHGKPVLGFVHKDPNSLPVGRCEKTPEAQARLEAFRELVKQKMCRAWDSPADLGSQVSRSLTKLIKSTPAVGWVRGDLVPETSAAAEILSLKKEIEELQQRLQTARTSAPEGTSDLVQGEDAIALPFTFGARGPEEFRDTTYPESFRVTWNELFAAVAPAMIGEASDGAVRAELGRLAMQRNFERLTKDRKFKDHRLADFRIGQDDFQTIKVQLRALGLVTQSRKPRSVKDSATYWTLTPYGDTVMTRLRALRKG
jgi:hypothetical protein